MRGPDSNSKSLQHTEIICSFLVLTCLGPRTGCIIWAASPVSRGLEFNNGFVSHKEGLGTQHNEVKDKKKTKRNNREASTRLVCCSAGWLRGLFSLELSGERAEAGEARWSHTYISPSMASPCPPLLLHLHFYSFHSGTRESERPRWDVKRTGCAANSTRLFCVRVAGCRPIGR